MTADANSDIRNNLLDTSNLIKKLVDQLQVKIELNSKALENIKLKWNEMDLKHAQEYENFQKKSKERSQLQDKINRAEIGINTKILDKKKF